ncbi:MAG: response regulator [Candidatus Kapabacteria bacterium]|nr:response regulator [Candidatus Kapabacteria bacterium]
MDFQNFLICVIEDNKPVNKLLSTVLTKAGFECVAFYNGLGSLEWLKSNQASAILIDILLPDIHGTQLLEKIREMPNYKSIPIIAVTGLSGNLTKDNLLNAGFDYFISKPININTFPSEIENIIKIKKG